MPAVDWQIAIYCHNEAQTVTAAIASVVAAIGGHNAAICIILNGSTDQSAARATEAAAAAKVPVTVHRIAHGDKSNAINQFFYTLRQPATLYFGVDAHCSIAPNALGDLAACLAADPHAQASTGVAGNGRTMRTSTVGSAARGGRINGPLYAIRAGFLDRMTAASIRLPVDLYRGDGLLGSLLAHDLDPLARPWDDGRAVSVPTALFYISQLSPFRLSDVLRQYRRKLRQMRGVIENAALKAIIYSKGFTGLPADMNIAIDAFVAERGVPPIPPLDRPFMAIALGHNRRAHRATPAELRPDLIFANTAARDAGIADAQPA